MNNLLNWISRIFFNQIIFWIESWVKQYWIEYWMNHWLAKFKHWIESQIGYRPPLPPFHPVIPLLHPYTPVPAWYKPITPYCITVTPSYTPVAWSTNCLDLSIVSKFNLADPSRTNCPCNLGKTILETYKHIIHEGWSHFWPFLEAMIPKRLLWSLDTRKH